MQSLWSSLFDSHYDGVNLLVTIVGVLIFALVLYVLLLKLQDWHEAAHVAPVRPPKHFEPGGTRTSLSDALRAAGITVQEIPGWKPNRMHTLLGVVSPSKMMIAAAMDAELEEQRRRMIEEIDAQQLQHGTPPFVNELAQFDPDWAEKVGIPLGVEMFGEPHHGFTILHRPPYDWQREDSGLT